MNTTYKIVNTIPRNNREQYIENIMDKLNLRVYTTRGWIKYYINSRVFIFNPTSGQIYKEYYV